MTEDLVKSTEVADRQAGENRADIGNSLAGKYMTFRLAHEEYGIEILKVREIIGMMSVTRVPRTPEFIRGVINLRGKVIPVIDLSNKFEMPKTEETETTVIIVVQLANQAQNTDLTMGIIVDEVLEVLGISAEQIEPPPSMGRSGTSFDIDFILGIGKVDKKVLFLLDINKILTAPETSNVSQMATQ
jgi:purine-binding chemotaxis protein CheW